jgi:hypothetical protein
VCVTPVEVPGNACSAEVAAYAAGILITPDGALTHDGDWAGFLTTFNVSADHRIAVAVSCNGRPPSDIEEITEELQTEWAKA